MKNKCMFVAFLLCGWITMSCAQSENLNVSIRLIVPEDATTVGEVVMSILEPTGYQFVVGAPASPNAADIALQPVPPPAFDNEVMTVADALLLLIGKDHRLLVDTKHHWISFD